jgi:hypothetical protein
MRYVEQNPCRAFMVKEPEQYRWSSAAAHLGDGKDRSGLLDMDFWEKAGGAQTWREMHSFEGDRRSGPTAAALHLRGPSFRRGPVCDPAGAAVSTLLAPLGFRKTGSLSIELGKSTDGSVPLEESRKESRQAVPWRPPWRPTPMALFCTAK